MKIQDYAIHERPRERLEQFGPTALSTAELLAVVLRQGTPQENIIILAQRLLKNYSLQKLAYASPTQLQEIKGIGTVKSGQLLACFELGRRVASSLHKEKLRMDTAQDVATYLTPLIGLLDKEHFKVLYLDSRMHLLKEETLFVGTLTSSLVDPRAIFKRALEENAAGIIVAHNHPSGNPTPSQADVEVTDQLYAAGLIMGIDLVDHVIISHTAHYSLREKGHFTQTES